METGDCLVAFAFAVSIGCGVAVFRFLLDKWNISAYIDTVSKPRKVCHWCFYTWWPCLAACIALCLTLAPFELIFFLPVSVIAATIGYVYLKSQPTP